MKKLIVSLFLAITLLSPSRTHALFGLGDIVFDPTAIVQTFSSAATLLKQFDDTILYRILVNAANIFVTNLINRFTEDTIRWINTGFQGGGPGYIVNPKAYFNNVANREMEIQLSSIQGTNNIFSNAVIGTAIRTVRGGKLPTGNQLEYTLSNTVQSSLCTEANITQMAIKAIDGGLTVGGIGMSRDAQIAQRKQLLYSQLCTRSPNGSAALQQSLTNCFAADFNCGGWSAYLDLGTNPNNTEYGQTIRAGQLIAAGVASKDAFAKAEIINGVLSTKKCTKYMANDDEGNPYPEGTAPCLEEKVQTPAAAVSGLLQSAIGAGPNRAAASTGTGIEGILTSLLVATLNKITSSAFSKDAPNGGGLNTSYVIPLNVSQAGRIGVGTNEFTSGTAGTNGNGPLISNTGGASALIANIRTALTTLNKVRDLLFSEVSMLNSYKSSLDELASCYSTLIGADPSMVNNAEVSSGISYVNSSRSSFLSTLPTAQKELSDVAPMINKFNGFITLLQNDSSSQTISSVYSQYSEAQANGSLFGPTKEITIQTEYDDLAKRTGEDFNQNLNPRLARCRQLSTNFNP